jgi:hypothetical protein
MTEYHINSNEPPVEKEAGDNAHTSYPFKRKVAIFLLAIVVLLVACIISSAYLWVRQSSKLQAEQADCEVVLDAFLQCMNNNDFVEARKYLYSAEGKEGAVSKLTSMKSGTLGAIFDRYRNVKVHYLQHQTPFLAINRPSLGCALIQGKVYYEKGYEGQLTAKMVHEESCWKILSINIMISQDKMNMYGDAHSK